MIETSLTARLPPASRWRRVASRVAAQLRGGVPAADPVLEALEPRLLLSAELGPGLDVAADVPFSGAGGTALDGFGEPALPAQPAALDLDALAALGGDASGDVPSARREIVFVDAGVEDYEALLDDLRRERDGVALEVVVLDSERDGVAQMDAALGAAREVDAVHVIAHGARGGVQIGATWLDGAALEAHAATIAGWQDVFTRDADLLIYGCHLAAGPEGRAFVAALASLTGADVAASDDLTGAAARGGDWTLEHASGAVETTLALSAHAQAGFAGVLAQITVNTTSDGISLFANTSSIANLIASPGLDGKISLREALAAANNDAGADTIFLQDANYRLTSVLDGDLDITDDVAIVGVSAGQTTIDGLGLVRVLDVSNDNITVSIANLTIANGLAGVLEGEEGGGLRVQGGGDTPVVTLDNVWFRDNATSGSNGSGGALYVGAGSVTVTNALFEDNTSRVGGGIHNDGASVTLTNVTLSNNTATNAEGGGLRNDGIATLNHVTVTLNDANTQGGGVFNAGTLHLTNSILADNTAGGTGPDLFGALATSGSNVFGEDDGGSGYAGSDHRDVDPLLVALADNGGLLPTHDLQGGSVAIDDAGTGASPALDQRGFVRDGSPDIGAHEASASAFTQVLFLDGRGDGGDLPIGALKIAAPDDPTLDNFDPDRDGDDGLVIRRGGSGAGESDPDEHQLWLSGVPGLSLDGPVTLDVWTAIRDFDLDDGATVHAFLVATNPGGAALSTLASATVTRADWDVADTGTWIADTFAFGNVTVDLPGDRFLGVKLVVDGASDDDVWFAYDATAYPARLNLAAGALNAPTASAAAGAPYTLAEGGTLALDGSASFDLDGTIVSWEWDVLGDGSFEKTGQTASYTWGELVAAGLDDDGTHDVTLRVTDDDAQQHSVTFSVTVMPDEPPVFVADGPFTLDEHSAFGTVVGDVDANDGDGADPGTADLIITEIMYDPASAEPDWEWIEIYNGGSETVDLAGFVLDDGNVNAHGAANIAAGSIAAGGTAVLYNADAVTAGDFTAAWGAGLNLVAVTGWSELPLNNDGDRIGLWSSFADYAGDHQVHANAIVSLVYDDLGPWPAPDDAGSIFLTDLAADPADGANWALSTLGAPSPHGGTAAQSAAAGGNSGNDAGTPGDAVPGGGVTYTITANANGDADGNLAFAIGATTGVITVNDPDDLDFESGTPLVISVEADDGFAQTTTNVTIHLNDVNDLPSGSGALTTTALDDDEADVKIFSGLSVADPDAGESDLVLRITLSDPAAGSIAGGGLVAQGGGVYERTGLTVAQANMALQVAQFTPTADTSDSGTFTTDISVGIDDQGGGGFQSVLAPTTMTVTRVNDAPAATNLSQTKPYVESGPAVDFDDIVVSDADAGETITATLTLTDTAAGALSVSGGATYTAGTGVWTITDSVANVNAALANVAFVPAPGYNADTTVLINIADGGEDGAAAATGSISLDGSSINDQLAATNTSQAKAYTEGAASVALDDIFVTDPDAGEIVTARLTLADPGAGSLTVSGSATYTGGTGVWTITDTVANVNTALANVAFAPGTDNDLDTSIAVHIADGGEDGTVPVTGTITLDVTPVNDQLGATNTNQVQGYTEDAPSVALDDIVVTDVDTGETVSATLTLADPGAGSLSVSGAATYSSGTGVWTITDTVTNVNAALANVAFAPAAHYDAATSIAVSLADGGEDGTVAVTGTIALNATPVGDTPQASNASTLKDVQSAPIALDRHAADGPEVTHFRISAITNGTLTLADGVSAVLDGQFVTVADGQAGLRFTPLPGSTLTGSFAVEASEDGVGVAAQSGQAIATVTVLDPGTPAPTPTPTPTPPPTTTPEPPDDAEEEAALASDFASAESLDDVPGAPAPDAAPPPGPADKAPDNEPADEDAPPAGPDPQIDGNPLHADEQPDDAVTLLDALPGGGDATLAAVAPDDDHAATRPAPYAAQVLAAAAGSPTIAADLAYLEGYLGDNDGPRLLESLAADPAFLEELDLARQDLEDVAALNLVFAGSTVAVSTGLSVGYVVWLARGGVLLASMLSSMPAWRLVDPLPILASLASEDDRGDGESLATLLEGADDADAQTPGDDDAE